MKPNEPPSSGTRRPSDQGKLSLSELTERAGVTVRTVRYYIAEGLLPPPVTAGPQSHYTAGHLDRLRLIARLKDAYLPLREIRRRLAGLDDDAVRELLRDSRSRPREPSPASDYLDRVLGAPQPRAGPDERPRAQPDQQMLLREPAMDDVAATRHNPDPATRQPSPLPVGCATPLPPALDPQATEEQGAPEAWRRVRLGDDAELLIRESSYQQRRDRIDWLIRWARRVFR